MALALRGLSFSLAYADADALLKSLAEVVQVDLEALRRSFEAREEYLELKYQPPSRVNYARVWDRLQRCWQSFLEVMQRGELSEALWPLFLLREGLTIVPDHRVEWAQSQLIVSGSSPAAGTTEAELVRTWEKHGLTLLRKKGIDPTFLTELIGLGRETTGAGLEHFQAASFGQAEQTLREALRIDPGQTEARLLLGDLLRRLDRIPEALAELQLAIEVEHLSVRNLQGVSTRPRPYIRMARARSCIGRSLLGLGRVKDAAEHLDRGLEHLDWVTRKNPPETLQETDRLQCRAEMETLHRLLEPIYRSLGEVERADHHRKRF